MRLLSIFTFASAALWAAAEVKHGTIGYGINMYHPWCCTACSDVLSSLFLNCTTFDDMSHEGHGMKKRMAGMEGPMGTTSPECYASSDVWLETFSYCVKSHCDAEGVSEDKQEKCWQLKAAGGLAVPTLKESQPPNPPTEEVADDAEWLNSTMLANEASWTSDRGTIMEFEKSEQDHVMFSIIIMSLAVGIPVLAGLWLMVSASRQSTLFHSIRSYFSLPALFGWRHSQPLRWDIGYVPNRALSSVLAVYILLNIVFNCVRFRSVQPSTWFATRDAEIAAYVGNRAGVLSFANMALAILFSARNNPLLYFSGWSQNTFLALHRWAARIAILQAIVHSIIYTADYALYMDENTLADEAKKPYWWWGIIGTTAMGLMAGASILPLRKWAYEVFLVVHIVLAIVSLVGCWYHIDIRYEKNWGYEVWLYLAFAFWAYDRLVRLAKLVFYSFLGGTSHGQVEAVPGTDNIISLKLYPARCWRAVPGQHTFVYFPSLGRFWENHPFTITGWGIDRLSVGSSNSSIVETSSAEEKHSDKGTTVTTTAIRQPLHIDSFYVRFLFRAHGGTTAKLYRALANHSPPTVLSEGPYGGHSPVTRSLLKHAEHVVIITGGIGITFAAAYVQQFAEERKHGAIGKEVVPKCQRMMLAWSVRERGLLEYARRELLPTATGAGRAEVEYRFWVTGGSPHAEPKANSGVFETDGQRMDIAATLGSALVKRKKTLVMVCGPGSMADDVRREVVRCSKQGYDVELSEESFTW